MASIDERVVAMSFENAKFEAGVAKTMDTLNKLDLAIKKVGGGASGFSDIDKAANKVTFGGLSTSIDKIKAKLGFGREAATGFGEIENASNKVTLSGLSGALDSIRQKIPSITGIASSALDKLKGKLNFGREAQTGFGEIDRAASKVTLTGATQAVDHLKGDLNFGREAATGFSELESASGRVSFAPLTGAIDGVTAKISAMQVAAGVALGNIATKAVSGASQTIKSFTLQPLTDGFHEYETQMTAVQTILSNTKASGADLSDVNKALNDLNKYSDKTIYNFTEMAKNIGTFTAAGVDLKTATSSIKGIANLAALSGSNSQQASTAMYQLSQAISSGRVGLQDWNSVVNAGMGGAVFQRALATTAEHMGALSKGAVTLKGKMKNVSVEGKSFRESIMAKPGESSWLTGKVLTQTLKQLSGNLSDADLKAQGYTKSQIKAIQAQAHMAVNAATQVKTFSGLLDTLKEAVGSGWGRTFQLIFGNFGEAKTLFTGLSNSIGGFIGRVSKARNTLLKSWKDMGGRTILLDGLKKAFNGILSIIKPIKDAFREIFPKKTGDDLLKLTERFHAFAQTLKIGPETADKLKRTFQGFFSILDIGKQVVVGIYHGIKTLFGEAGKGSGGFLSATGNIGDFFTAIDQGLKKSGALIHFFEHLGGILAVPIHLLGIIGHAIGSLFKGGSGAGSQDFSNGLSSISDKLNPMQGAVDRVTQAWNKFKDALNKVKQAFQPAIDGIKSFFKDVSDGIKDVFTTGNYDKLFGAFSAGIVGGLFLALKKAISGGSGDVHFDFGQGVLKGLTGTLNGLTGSLKEMQRTLKAATLMLIATAVAELAVGVKLLSTVDPKRMTSALTGITVGMSGLIAMMAVMSKLSSGGGGITIASMAGSMIAIALALDILTIAIKSLSKLSWGEMLKGLAGVGGSLMVLGEALRYFPLDVGRIGLAIIPIAIGLNILAVAMKIFATMKWEEIGKGVAAIGAALFTMGVALEAMPKNSLLLGAGLVVVAAGLTLLAGAVLAFGAMDLSTLAKGIVGIGVALVAIGDAVAAMPKTMALQAAGLVILGVALTGIAGALALLGGQSVWTLVKGIGAMGIALDVLSAGLMSMEAALPGAAALLVSAGAIGILAPALVLMGSVPLLTLVKGLGAMGIALLIIGKVGEAAAPGLLALTAVFVGLGAAVFLAGAGMGMVARGISLIGKDGGKGFAMITAAMVGFMAVLPKVLVDFVKGLVSVVGAIAEVAPKLVDAMLHIIEALVTVIIRAAPKIAVAVGALISAFLKILVENAPKIIAAGVKLLLDFLSGVSKNIVRVVSLAADIVTKFLNTLAKKLPSLISAGAKLIVAFLKGIAAHAPKIIAAGAKAIVSFLGGIAKNISKVVVSAGKVIGKFVEGLVGAFGKIIASGAKAVVKFMAGIAGSYAAVAKGAVKMVAKFFDATVKAALSLIDAGAKAVLKFLHGIASAINKYSGQFRSAGLDIAAALINGMTFGLTHKVGGIFKAIKGIFDQAIIDAKGVGVDSAFKHNSGSGGGKSGGKKGKAKPPAKARVSASSRSVPILPAPGKYHPEVAARAAAVVKAAVRSFESAVADSQPDVTKIGGKLGLYVVKGFSVGIRQDNLSDVKSALTEMRSRMTTGISDIRQTIAEEENKLKKLKHPGHGKSVDKKAVKELEELIGRDTRSMNALIKLRRLYDKDRTDPKHAGLKQGLLDIAKDTERVTGKLKDATDKLKEAKQALAQSFTDYLTQYSTLPEVNHDTRNPFTAYIKSLTTQIANTDAYGVVLDKLRTMGLDDQTYKKLVDEGPVDLKFAQQILAGGTTAIEQIKKLTGALDLSAAKIADPASHAFYDAGVKAAQDSVDGLTRTLSDLSAKVELYGGSLAAALVKGIKKALKIKSPSRVMMDIGAQSVRGLSNGLANNTPLITQAGVDVANAMKESMKNVSSILTNDIDASPVITPILDLSQFKKDARVLDMSNVTPITAASSYGQAMSISQERAAMQAMSDALAASAAEAGIKFEQNNYSPESLSTAEIYRRTKSQLAQAKAALA